MTRARHFLILLLCASLLAAIAGCSSRGNSPDNLLARIDSLADVNPDSADQLLKAAPVSSLKGEENERVRLLLRIKTDDKLYRPVTQYRDTILQLVDYFEHHRKVLPSLLGTTGPALPYLYAGRIFADLGDAPQALDYYQRALDVQPLTPLHIREGQEGVTRLVKQRGLLYSFIGETMYYQCLYSESVASFQESFHYAGLIKDTLDMIYTLRDIAEQYKFLDSNDSSLLYYKKALSLAVSSHNTKMRNDVMAQIASLYIKTNNFDSAYYYIKPSLQKIDTADITATYSIASKIYKHRGNIDSTLICYNKLLLYGNLDGKYFAHKELSHYYLLHNDTRKAFQHIQSFITYDDTIKAYRNAETVARMHAAYNYQKHERETARLQESNAQMRFWLLLSVLSLVIVGALLLIALISRRYRNKLRKSSMSKLDLLRLSHEHYPEGREAKALSEVRNTPIYETIQKCIQEGSGSVLTEEDWQSLHKVVNGAFSNFEEKLRGLVSLNEQEYRICLLTKIDVKPVHIAQLTARSREAITSSRRRLYQKATNTKGKPQDWDEIVRLL